MDKCYAHMELGLAGELDGFQTGRQLVQERRKALTSYGKVARLESAVPKSDEKRRNYMTGPKAHKQPLDFTFWEPLVIAPLHV